MKLSSIFFVLLLISCSSQSIISPTKDASQRESLKGNLFSGIQDSIRFELNDPIEVQKTGVYIPVAAKAAPLDISKATIQLTKNPRLEKQKLSSLVNFNEDAALTENSYLSSFQEQRVRFTLTKVSVKPAKHHSAKSPRYKDASAMNIQYLELEQGLNSTHIKTIIKDKSGDIWLGTNGGGIIRYDGVKFSSFTKSNGMISDIIISSMEDSKGRLWFGSHDGGLTCYDGHFFSHFILSKTNGRCTVMSITEDSRGNIWFGTYANGLFKFDGHQLLQFAPKNKDLKSSIQVLKIDESDNLWIGTNQGKILKYNGLKLKTFPIEINSNRCNIQDLLVQNDTVVIGTSDNGLIKLKDGKIYFISDNKKLASLNIRKITTDQNGHVWLGTYGEGLVEIKKHSFRFITKKEGLTNNYISDVLIDENGIFWIGTLGGGLNKFEDGTFSFFTTKDGLQSNAVSATAICKTGIWLGGHNGYLGKFKEGNFYTYLKSKELNNYSVRALQEDKHQHILIGTEGGGLFKLNKNRLINYEFAGLKCKYISSVIVDRNNNYWVGSQDAGLFFIKKDSIFQFDVSNGLISNQINAIEIEEDGSLWIGSNKGASRFDGTHIIHYTTREGLSNNNVLTIKKDKLGHIWLGTFGGGVNMFSGKSFSMPMEEAGLNSSKILSISEDINGEIWMLTENALINLISPKFGPLKDAAAYRVNQFSTIDGLKNTNFFINSLKVDSSNKLWWGTRENLSSLNLETFKASNKAPQIKLRDIDINGNIVDYRTKLIDKHEEINFNEVKEFENYPLEPSFSYKNNHLSFHFSAIDWQAPEKIKYAFRLKGLNNDWSALSHETKADFRSIPHGDYIFEVKAFGESDIWGKTIKYPFTVEAPWWHTWWAYGTYLGLLIISILMTMRWKTIQLKKRQLELISEVEFATHKIRRQKQIVENQKEEVVKQKEIIEDAHKEITDSIRYAKRIQNAILPPSKLVKKFLPNSFVFYQPKDVVAGDFYWVQPMANKVIFAAADCTGHGVPGAMVSVVCNNGLNRSVREYQLSTPGEILTKTRDIVIQEFEKSEEEVKDGMDIALCTLEGRTLQYAGAHNPLWVIRQGAQEIEEIKANKQPIGQFDNPVPYDNHTIQLNSGDSFYLFSDGFADQFGGEKGKKFKSANFKRLLLSIQSKSMNDQLEYIRTVFTDWRGSIEQLDDVCVFGVKVD